MHEQFMHEKVQEACAANQINFKQEIVRELCDKLVAVCPVVQNKQYRCTIDQACDDTFRISVIHELDKTQKCSFWYNLRTRDLTMEGNPDFWWKVEYPE